MPNNRKQKNFFNQYFFLGLIAVAVTTAFLIFSHLQLKSSSDQSQKYNQKNNNKIAGNTSFLSGQKKYNLNYSDLPLEYVYEIHDSVSGNNYQSSFIVSRDGKPEDFTLLKSLNLKDYQYITLSVYWDAAKDTATGAQPEIQSLNLRFGGQQPTDYYNYAVFNLSPGRNFIKIDKSKFIVGKKSFRNFGWSKIQAVKLVVVSRPQSFAQIEIEKISAEKNDQYLKQWQVVNDQFLSLAKDFNNKVKLKAQNVGAYLAILKEVGNVKNFNYQAKISPQRSGRGGLFFRGDYRSAKGYYFYLGGAGSNEWQLVKVNKKGDDVLAKGQIRNNYFSSNREYRLRVEAKGLRLTGYISFDEGKTFLQLFQVYDSEFLAGGVGIAVTDGSAAYFDDFEFWE